MAWNLLAAALPYAAQAVGQYITRPKEEEFKPQTQYMKKYLSYLRGRQSEREVYHMAMRPALRAIGGQGRRMQRDIGYQAARSGVAGSGIEAQQRLTAGKMTMEAMQEASEKATAAQISESRRTGEAAALTEAKIGAEEERSAQAYQAAKSQWGRQMVSTGIQAVGALGSQAITSAVQGKNMRAFAIEHIEGGEIEVDRLLKIGMNINQVFTHAQDEYQTAIILKREAGKQGVAFEPEQIGTAQDDTLEDMYGVKIEKDADVSVDVPVDVPVVEPAPEALVEPAPELEGFPLAEGLEKKKREEAIRVAAEEARVKEASRLARIADPDYFLKEEVLTKEETLARLREPEVVTEPEPVALVEPAVPEVEPVIEYQSENMSKDEQLRQNTEFFNAVPEAEGKSFEERKKMFFEWKGAAEPVVTEPKTEVVPETVDTESQQEREEMFKRAQEGGYEGTYWDWLDAITELEEEETPTNATKLKDWNPPKNVDVTVKKPKGGKYTAQWYGEIDNGKYVIYLEGEINPIKLTKQQFMSAVLEGQNK